MSAMAQAMQDAMDGSGAAPINVIKGLNDITSSKRANSGKQKQQSKAGSPSKLGVGGANVAPSIMKAPLH